MPETLGTTLDSVLAFIVITLLLSLIVQGIQNAVKRVLRWKSAQLEQSLKYLFDYVFQQQSKGLKEAAPALKSITPDVAKSAQTTGDKLLAKVREEFAKMGRRSFAGKPIIESVTKEDVLVVVKALKATAAFDIAEDELKKIEEWYDTVMPGVAERYERAMKWTAVVISTIVVLLLNADAFHIYQHIASDPAVRNELNQRAEEMANAENKNQEQDIQLEIQTIRSRFQDYESFGFTPFDWKSTDGKTPLGWLIMILLISLGAPFWQDALEAVFGLKKALRDRPKADGTAPTAG